MTIWRARFINDVCYRTEDGLPLKDEDLQVMGERGGTYLRVAAAEGLDREINVVFDEDYIHQTAHHHDARYDRCSYDRSASTDDLGPEDE